MAASILILFHTVFVWLAGNLLPPGRNGDFPKAQTQPLQTKSILVLEKDGKVALNGVSLPINALRERLIKEKTRDPSFRVVVRGQSDTSYSDVIAVLDILTELHLAQPGLVTKAIESKSATEN